MMRKRFGIIIVVLALVGLAVQACNQQVGADEREEWPSGYTPPIEGATFSLGRPHLPNAERSYRQGSHQGFDFFDGLSTIPVEEGRPVVAVADGEVVRIDVNYADLSQGILNRYAELASQGDVLSDFALDQLRGRQVWLRHEGGYVSRYAHLKSVNSDLVPGATVEQGARLGTVGRSGMVEGDESDDRIPHLHYELWSPEGGYLGEDRDPLGIHRLVEDVFGESALPRYSRRVLASVAEGELPPETFPPETLPNVNLRTTPPEQVTAGQPFAISVAWSDDAIRADDVIVAMGERPLGIIDGGNGVWIIGVAEAPGRQTLAISAVDQYGQSLSGAREMQVVRPEEQPAPLEWPQTLIAEYTVEGKQREAETMLQAAQTAYERRDPYWEEPFMGPLNGRVVRSFGQMVTSEETEPSHPLPGLYLMPDEPGATVHASNRGKVVFAGEMPLRGKTVLISHGGGTVSVYAHLDAINVSSDEMVERGQPIGVSGTSGAMDQEILRWEIHVTGVASDPLGWLGQVLPRQY